MTKYTANDFVARNLGTWVLGYYMYKTSEPNLETWVQGYYMYRTTEPNLGTWDPVQDHRTKLGNMGMRLLHVKGHRIKAGIGT